MSLAQLSASGDCPLRVFISDGTTGASLNKAFGQVSVPALDILLDFGTGSAQANKLYVAKRTLAATTYDLMDLAGSLADGLGNTITFTYVKLALLAVVSPTGLIKVRAGPQGQANPWIGPWTGGVGATVYKDVPRWDLVAYEPVTGYAVTAGTGDIFPIYNPGAASLDYWVVLAGI